MHKDVMTEIVHHSAPHKQVLLLKENREKRETLEFSTNPTAVKGN